MPESLYKFARYGYSGQIKEIYSQGKSVWLWDWKSNKGESWASYASGATDHLDRAIKQIKRSIRLDQKLQGISRPFRFEW